MADAPSVLMIDDGELDGIHRMLKRLGVDHVRLRGGEIRRELDAPRDLLISAGRRTLNDMPRVVPAPGARATWVCVHNQDFLPMRERLREMGVDFLVHSALDEESLRLFLVQLLFSESDRRGSLRLPLGGQVFVQSGGERQPARLAELSRVGCRIVASRSGGATGPMEIVLPPVLGGGEELLLPVEVVRTAECQTRSGGTATVVALRFGAMTDEARVQLDRICAGAQIGTRVSPLAAADSAGADVDLGSPQEGSPQEESPQEESLQPEAPVRSEMEAEPEPEACGERRGQERLPYERQVLVLGTGDPNDNDVILGRDLSLDGVRISGCPPLESGTRVSLALYSGRREEPLLVKGIVMRSTADGEVALQFDGLSPSERRQLERLAERLPLLESLSEDSEQAGPVVMARVRKTAA